MIHLITGYAGKEHITSDDQAAFNRCIVGGENYVFDTGSKLSASVLSNTEVSIADGEMQIAGRHIRIEGSEIVNFDIGEQGKERKDLIIVVYKKDETTGIESAELQVVKGTSGSSEAPEYDENAFLLYEVLFDGFSLKTITAKFDPIMSVYDAVKNVLFALSTNRFKINPSDWSEGEDGKYSYSEMISIGAKNYIDSTSPYYFLDTDWHSYLPSTASNTEKQNFIQNTLPIMKLEYQYIMLNVSKLSDGSFKYTFESDVKPSKTLIINAKGV